eukprot:2769686-Amphidinium_carterae.2
MSLNPPSSSVSKVGKKDKLDCQPSTTSTRRSKETKQINFKRSSNVRSTTHIEATFAGDCGIISQLLQVITHTHTSAIQQYAQRKASAARHAEHSEHVKNTCWTRHLLNWAQSAAAHIGRAPGPKGTRLPRLIKPYMSKVNEVH